MGKKREDYPGMYPMRACHDCGKPTRDYRCAKCRARLRARLRLDADCLDLEAEVHRPRRPRRGLLD